MTSSERLTLLIVAILGVCNLLAIGVVILALDRLRLMLRVLGARLAVIRAAIESRGIDTVGEGSPSRPDPR